MQEGRKFAFLALIQANLYFGLAQPVINATFNEVITGTITSSGDNFLIYKYELANFSQAIRVWVHSEQTTVSDPLFVVIRQHKDVLSWQIPLPLEDQYYYNTIERTLCPPNISQLEINQEINSPPAAIYVVFSIDTSAPAPVSFKVSLTLMPNFLINLNERRYLNVSPSEPHYVGFVIPKHLESIVIHIRSNDDICMVISVQDTICPVYDLDTNVASGCIYQTMTKKSSITLERWNINDFFLVFVVKPNDYLCNDMYEPGFLNQSRTKTIEVWIEEGLRRCDYVLPIVFTSIGLLIIVGCLIGCLEYINKRDKRYRAANRLYNENDENDRIEIVLDEEPIAAAANPQQEPIAEANNPMGPRGPRKLAELAQKPYPEMKQKYDIYWWNAITIGIFYTLPAFQVVLNAQNLVTATGNRDLCYYNYECAHRWGPFVAFNAIFSNIGYVAFGFAFLIIVKRRHSKHQKRMIPKNADHEKTHGIPHYYGQFYALGVALVLEGCLSATYHICPNYANFQFDTTFMYIIAMLCILKIYQTRHPDISTHAHIAYAVMALIIFIVAIAIYNKDWSWTIFILSWLFLIVFLSIEFYYKSEWKIDWGVFERLQAKLKCPCSPIHPGRLAFSIILFLANVGCLGWGLLFRPNAFSIYILFLFLINLVLYLGFYLVMKCVKCERRRARSWCIDRDVIRTLIGILAVVFWIASICYFVKARAIWEKTAAQSREHNDKCILFGFYDTHDIWHLLSSLGLILSFIFILVMDNDLICVHQKDIDLF